MEPKKKMTVQEYRSYLASQNSPAQKKGNKNRGHVAQGWREIGGQRIYFRSKAEANYVRFINYCFEKKIPLYFADSLGPITAWEYEPKTFKFKKNTGNNTYKPDVKVHFGAQYEWHEVKGWLDPPSKAKLNQMAREYPQETVRLIMGKQVRAIGKAFGASVPGWEF